MGQGGNVKRCIEVEIRRTRHALYIARGQEHRELEEVAALIWRLANGRRSLEDIADAVCQEYDVSRETARRDTEEFVAELQRDGFLTTV